MVSAATNRHRTSSPLWSCCACTSEPPRAPSHFTGSCVLCVFTQSSSLSRPISLADHRIEENFSHTDGCSVSIGLGTFLWSSRSSHALWSRSCPRSRHVQVHTALGVLQHEQATRQKHFIWFMFHSVFIWLVHHWQSHATRREVHRGPLISKTRPNVVHPVLLQEQAMYCQALTAHTLVLLLHLFKHWSPLQRLSLSSVMTLSEIFVHLPLHSKVECLVFSPLLPSPCLSRRPPWND